MSLMGNIQSDDQRALPGAAIIVIHLPSGKRYAAASNASGQFFIQNLQAGGPYLMKVGEGGFRPETMESIFLEKDKVAKFTVTLSRLNSPNKSRLNRTGKLSQALTASTEVLAPESTVGGPVYFKTMTAGTPGSSTIFRPLALASAPATPEVAAPAPLIATPVATAAAVPAAPRYRRYPARGLLGKANDPVLPGRFDTKTGNYIYETGQPTTLKLGNDKILSGVGVNSTESNLFRFLTNPQMQVDTVDLTKGWYNFDRVFFDLGKATLTGESLAQLRNIATVLQAYPKARIKLGGYTDSTGTYKANYQLSEARARAAWTSLVEMGISPDRIDARGYGPRYAIAPNTSEEGRAQNRRLSLKVLEK